MSAVHYSANIRFYPAILLFVLSCSKPDMRVDFEKVKSSDELRGQRVVVSARNPELEKATVFLNRVREGFRSGGIEVTAVPAQCEASGLCFDDQSRDERQFLVHFFRRAPQAIRFTTHVATELSCNHLEGVTLTQWTERAGVPNMAGGWLCIFRESDALHGMTALIENNRGTVGFNTAIHVYSPEYFSKDTSFAGAVKREAGMAQ